MQKVIKLFVLAILISFILPLTANANPNPSPTEPQIYTKKETLPGGINVEFSIVSVPKYKGEVDKVFNYTFTEIGKIAQTFNGSGASNDIKKVEKAAGGDTVKVSKETAALAAHAKDIAEWTKGAYDPVGGDGTYRNLKVNKKKNTIKLTKPGLTLDLTGIMDGFMADLFIRAAHSANVENAQVVVNGVTRTLGRASYGPWSLQISGHSDKYAKHGRKVTISNYSAATVGGIKPAPTIDPRTGKELNSPLYSVTVITKEAATSQGVANSVFVLGPDAGEHLIDSLGIRAILAFRDGSMKQVGRWPSAK